jgi:hypothetical protein
MSEHERPKKGLILPGYQAAIYSLQRGKEIARLAARQAALRMDVDVAIAQDRLAESYEAAIELLGRQLIEMLEFQRTVLEGGANELHSDPRALQRGAR